MFLKACVLDTETTGFSHSADDLIELGLVLFEYDPIAGGVGRTLKEYVGLRDPGRPIPIGATQAHGMTWDDVRGHKLDDEAVRSILSASSMVVAHNAKFDRGFVSKLYPEVERLLWKCTMDGIAWKAKGFRSKGLQELLRDHSLDPGTAHRALDDARNTLRLVSLTQPNGKTYFSELLATKR